MRSLLISILTLSFYLTSLKGSGQIITPDSISDELSNNWFNLDPELDSVLGISTNKAYTLLNAKKAATVIVAIIDSGVDIEHEDLNGVIWSNEGEIPDNGIDDDLNGYIDDVHGWNFIGNANGENIIHDSHELTREYVRLKAKFNGRVTVNKRKKEKNEFEYYLRIKKEFEKQKEEKLNEYKNFQMFNYSFNISYDYISGLLDKDTLTVDDLEQFQPQEEFGIKTKGMLLYAFDLGIGKEELKEAEVHFGHQINYAFNEEFDPRSIVGDDYSNLDEKYYGNNDVKGPDASHGTHIAGVIAAIRNNNIGIDGICNSVKIMSIRAVPDGDERDKDIANAIYYASDNGANIINMSFGKNYSPNKDAVDKAIRYAEEKGILIIHAAGNDSENIDLVINYPSKRFNNNELARYWIEVGASDSGKNNQIVGEFTNFGKQSVNVFAPGVSIYSLAPNNEYQFLNGTSMAAPMVTGIAALLMAYYPELSVSQIQEILLSSSIKYNDLLVDPPSQSESEDIQQVEFGSLSVTGGIINAYEAVKMADSILIKSLN